MGIPIRRYYGWEPVTTTEYHYDSEGRLLTAITTRESEWSAVDVAALDALADYHGGFSPCGHSRDSLWDSNKAQQPKFVGVFDVCLECQAVERSQHVQAKKDKNSKPEQLLASARLWRSHQM